MNMQFVEELRWRGMIHDVLPGTEEQLLKEQTSGYLGIDNQQGDNQRCYSLQVLILSANHYHKQP